MVSRYNFLTFKKSIWPEVLWIHHGVRYWLAFSFCEISNHSSLVILFLMIWWQDIETQKVFRRQKTKVDYKWQSSSQSAAKVGVEIQFLFFIYFQFFIFYSDFSLLWKTTRLNGGGVPAYSSTYTILWFFFFYISLN